MYLCVYAPAIVIGHCALRIALVDSWRGRAQPRPEHALQAAPHSYCLGHVCCDLGRQRCVQSCLQSCAEAGGTALDSCGRAASRFGGFGRCCVGASLGKRRNPRSQQWAVTGPSTSTGLISPDPHPKPLLRTPSTQSSPDRPSLPFPSLPSGCHRCAEPFYLPSHPSILRFFLPPSRLPPSARRRRSHARQRSGKPLSPSLCPCPRPRTRICLCLHFPTRPHSLHFSPPLSSFPRVCASPASADWRRR
jgi:hypothetical protein